MSKGPLSGITVLDLGHTVMGPTCGLILADMGATVIKIEPSPGGDPTRRLKGFGTGYFGFLNRNKDSVAIDLKSRDGRALMLRLVERSDVLIENFGPGTMERLGLGFGALSEHNPRLVYASLKGFFDGPYGKRLALDEVVQMMSGLAYMTGPTGRPLRAGSSVIDIVGGMFAVIAIQAALRQREDTGRGQLVGSSLYESAVFLMGQHLCYAEQTDVPVPPMPNRVSAWAVYDTFRVRGDEMLFVGITSDAHWQRFTQAASLTELAADQTLASNNDRIAARERLIPILRAFFSKLEVAEAVALCEAAQVPFAEVRRPEDLFEDPHLLATGGLVEVQLPNGVKARVPKLPIKMEGLGRAVASPPEIGASTRRIIGELGVSEDELDALIVRGVLAAPERGKVGQDAGRSNQSAGR